MTSAVPTTISTVFISYSHKDGAWKDWLLPHLGMLERQGRITVWHDRQIDTGGKWYPEIFQAMARARVAICLISADYLASEFCTREEIPYLLDRCEKGGMVLIPLLVRPCLWDTVPWLSETQMIPRDGKSVAEDFKGYEDGVFAQVARKVYQVIGEPTPQDVVDESAASAALSDVFESPAGAVTEEFPPPEKVDITRLPQTGAELFGRRKGMALLEEVWDDPGTNVLSLVA